MAKPIISTQHKNICDSLSRPIDLDLNNEKHNIKITSLFTKFGYHTFISMKLLQGLLFDDTAFLNVKVSGRFKSKGLCYVREHLEDQYQMTEN